MKARAAFGLLILVSWVALIGWHARREYLQPEMTRLAQATMTLAPGTHFYSLEMGGEPIGLGSSLLDTIPAGFAIEDVMNLELRALGQTGRADVRTRVVVTPTLELSEFEFSLAGAQGAFEARGRMDGDSLLRVTVGEESDSEELSFRVEEPPLVAAALPIRLAKGGDLRVGRTFRFPVFDPSTVSLRPVEIEVLETDTMMLPDSAVIDPSTGRWIPAELRPETAWRIRESFAGMSTESWIDSDGRVIRSISPMGFSIERMPFDLAMQRQDDLQSGMAGTGGSGDVIFSTAIASGVPPGALDERDELRVVLSGVDLDGFDLDGGRQVLRGDTLVVRRESWEGLDPGYSLPYPRMDLRAALEAEPLIQSGDERIQNEARRIAGSGSASRDPMRVADRLVRAVYGMLEKEVSFAIPSATQVLESRRGDCNEHTVLFVAMARSLGLPARVAVGLVHLDGLFLYHAWPEVWLGEWVAVDPTLGEIPAGATHLRFVSGGLAQQIDVARLVGALGIEVVDG